ncbi:hypothetical protein HUG10_13225 [Halorarum halophilum]|uniref:Uncharacterized protein n=1 Tax=Halorarum halophilum TaxID=2743090 RepID=A0A7D5GGJ0_9EURY|nr:hypothetical protein [Halobaculum halophilum]QLG28450.1 hypothetical protein HUG10_13225 [Halobaculum halophilum]
MTRGRTESEVMASVDENSSEFVIADIAREDAWLSVEERDAPVLEQWC